MLHDVSLETWLHFYFQYSRATPSAHSLFSQTMKICLIVIWSSADSDCPRIWQCSLLEVCFCFTGSCSLPLSVYTNISTLLTTTSCHILEDSNLQNVWYFNHSCPCQCAGHGAQQHRHWFQDFVYGDTWKDLVCQQKVERDVLLHHIFVATTCVKDSSNKLMQTIHTIHTHIRLCTETEGSHFQNVLKLEQYKFHVINCLYLFMFP